MAINSTAELLFNIRANADDAGENITRFRALMGTSIEDMAAQFKSWADETIGEIDGVKAAMTVGIAAIAAGVLAAGVAIKDSTDEYMAYVSEIGKAARLTGISTEALSALHSAAKKTGVEFEALTSGLVKFESSVVKASQGNKVELDAFRALGISQKDLIQGQNNLLPLLEKTMDGFHGNASAVQKAALARDVFSRQGPELLAVLSKGSEYLKENAEEAEKWGLIIHTKDVDAAKQYKIALTQLKDEFEGLTTAIGRHVVPMLVKAEAAMVAATNSWKHLLKGLLPGGEREAVSNFVAEYAAEMQKLAKATEPTGKKDGDSPPIVGGLKEAKQEFRGITEILDSLNTKLAEQGTPWDRLRNEMEHYREEIDKTSAELQKLAKEGKITPESFRQQMATLSLIPNMIARVAQASTDKINAEETKAWGEAVTKSAEAQEKLTYDLQMAAETRATITREIREREAIEDETGYEGQRARLQREIADWAAAMAKRTELTEEDVIAIDRITTAGLDKIAKTQAEAFNQELGRLYEHLDQTTAANATAGERLWLDYQRELQQYSAIEEAKAKKTAQTEAEVAQIERTYAQVRSQLLLKYQNDLQQLRNSQGFQGVFGSFFGSMIRQNSDLWRQWATSTNQSLQLVKVSLQGLKQMAQQTFGSFVQGMGQTMVQAIVTSKSVGQAMEAMLASTLESFAGQAMTAAIMATAWGFYNLAMGNYTAAGQDFTSAALFGSIGAATAVAANFMTPSQSSGGNGGGGGSNSGSSMSAGNGGGGAGSASDSGQQRPNVNVYVQGHIIGPNSGAVLADILNQATYNNDVTLYASHNTKGVQLR